MFTKIYVENFRSFKKFELDLLESNNPKKIKKALFVYGENGSGKSNLVEIFSFLAQSMNTVYDNHTLAGLKNIVQNENNSSILEELNNYISKHSLSKRSQLNNLVTYVKTLSIDKKQENMLVEFSFILGDSSSEGLYVMEFNDSGELIYESLDYIIGKKTGNLFTLENLDGKIDIKFSPKFYKNNSKELKKEIEFDIKSFWGKHSFLAIFMDRFINTNYSFLFDLINPNFLRVIAFFNSILIIQKSDIFQSDIFPLPLEIMKNLEEGSIELSNDEAIFELEIMEKILNEFYTSFYSDIQRIKYETKDESTLRNYTLTVHKRIGGEVVVIPFKQESQGTRHLLSVLPSLIALMEGHIVIIDEIDLGIHDLLMSKIVLNLLEALKDNNGQLLVTTHNTQLLESINPSNVGILAVDSYGYKEINLLKDSDIKTNNSLLKKYLKGDFYGTPEMADLDFADLDFANLKSSIAKASLASKISPKSEGGK